MSAFNGGPAFPNVAHPFSEPGMSMRDWFAGQALGGILANSNTQCEPENQRALVNAATMLAYETADAMLRERAKP